MADTAKYHIDAPMAAWSARLRVVLLSALAGLLAGATEAVVLQYEGLGGAGCRSAAGLIVAGALLGVPAGALFGVLACLFLVVLPPQRLVAWAKRIPARLIIAVGIVAPLLVATSFHLFLLITERFRDPALAALASAVATAILFAATLALGAAVAAWAGALGRRFPVVANRLAAIAFVAVAWLAIALPGFLGGAEQAVRGPFGFVGLLRKDTLTYAPALTLAAFAIPFAFARSWLHLSQRGAFALATLLAVGSALGAMLAATDEVRPLVLDHGTLSRVSLRTLQSFGDWDRDGYSRWLGGGDCDDADPGRHPGAREIADNGVDEDCDGEDLHLKAPSMALRASIERDKLPPDLSFLIITVDALRPDLGFMGYERNVSPNIDALAKESVVFERAYSISTYTGFCLPPMMASRYPSEMPRTDRHEVRFLGDNVLLAERLSEAGFRTAGAASHFLFAPELGWVDGFERFVNAPLEGDAPPGSHVDLFHSSRSLANATVSLLQDAEVTQGRFFVWVHFLDPHKQYLAHPGYSRFGNTSRDLYDGEIAFTDAHIGRLLQALDASPLAARTAVILTGDHGEAFGEHGEYFHGAEVWDEIVRVPLLIRIPGGTPARISRRVSHVDIAPTVLDLAGLSPDSGARGQSLAHELFGGTLPDRPVLIDQPRNPHYRPKRAYIDGDLKLHHLIDSNSFRLYNLQTDPHETRDLASEAPDELRRMRTAYSAFVSRLNDVDPVPAEDATASE